MESSIPDVVEGSRLVQDVECSRRKGTGVGLREHVKVSGPRVPARQTLDMVGQDDLAGRVSVGGERA